MKTDNKSDDAFTSLRDLIRRIDAAGFPDAAADLREGFSCLNGLTDGWAQFLDSIDRAVKMIGRGVKSDDLGELKQVRKVVHGIVHRRR